MKKALMVLAVMALMMLSTAAADLSVQLKRTNPGIAGEKSAELIFDTGCYVKYIPFKVTTVKETVTETVMETVTDPETGVASQVPKEVTKEVSREVRSYQKMNAEYIETATDSDYREIRLDKTVPFARPGVQEPSCPEGQTTCSASEIVDLGAAGSVPKWVLLVAGLVVVLLVVYLLGKTSRKE